MITVVRIDNPYEPHRRETSEIEFVKGMTTEDVCKDLSVDDLVAGAVAHNGTLLPDGTCRGLEDGDFVTVVVSPGGPDFVAFLVDLAIMWFVGKVAAALMPSMDIEESPDSNYSYYGFQNSYLPEGSPVPVVYGTMRTAAPCINQTILGGGLGAGGSDLSTSRVESLNTLLALSEGPIHGLGDFIGPVTNEAEATALVNGQSLPMGLGMLVNGIGAEALEGTYRWRTGDQNQDSMHGDGGSLDTSGASTNYTFNQKITIGTNGIDGSSGEHPSGVVSYGSRIIDTDTTQSVSIALTEKASIVNLQFFFDKGLYSGGNDGTPDNQSVNMRVQYWETDVSGAATGTQAVVLAPVVITHNQIQPFGADYRFELWSPSSVTVGGLGGYLNSNTQNYGSRRGWFRLEDPAGLALQDPGTDGFYAGCWLNAYDQTATDYHSPTTVIMSWGNCQENGAATPGNGMHQNFIFTSSTTVHGTAMPAAYHVNHGRQGWVFTWARVFANTVNGNGDVVAGNAYGYQLSLVSFAGGFTQRYRSGTWSGVPNGTGWHHVGFSYNRGTAANGSGDTVTFYRDGVAYTSLRETNSSTSTASVYPPFPTASSVFSIGNLWNAYSDSGDNDENRSTRCAIQGVFMAGGSPPPGLFDIAANQIDIATGGKNWSPAAIAHQNSVKVAYDCFHPQGTASLRGGHSSLPRHRAVRVTRPLPR